MISSAKGTNEQRDRHTRAGPVITKSEGAAMFPASLEAGGEASGGAQRVHAGGGAEGQAGAGRGGGTGEQEAAAVRREMYLMCCK